MQPVYICDAIRTPFGRYGGALASIRADDLAALPIRALMSRNASVDWNRLDDVIYGCANQSGEDNRNVARMALLLAGLPKEVPGVTINRLCGSSLDAISVAARAIKIGEASLIIAGGVESMSRAPFVMGKADAPFSRAAKLEDTTMGWRFVNPLMKEKYGVDSILRRPKMLRGNIVFRARTKTTSRCAAKSAPQRRNRPAFSRTRLPPSTYRKRKAHRFASIGTSILALTRRTKPFPGLSLS